MTTLLDDVLGGRYRLTGVLGRGGMADVYQAIDERSGASVAVKLVRSPDPDHARRLAQEVRALERFDHPALIRLLDSGVSGDRAYLVMELVDGPSLAEILRRGPLSSAATARLGAGLAAALAYVHDHGIVHRDVKPANVLVGAGGVAKLGDFGIARLLDASTLTLAGTTLGTAAYMAPEQLENHQVGPKADIWSLGILLLECLTGRRVYEGTPSEVVARRLAGPVPLPANLPAEWKLVLSSMLDHQPDQRLDGHEVADRLASPGLSAPWDMWGPPAEEDPGLTARYDLTALAPDPERTSVDPAALAAPAAVPVPSRGRPSRRRAGVIAGAIAAAVLAIVLIALDSGPSRPIAARTTTTTAALRSTPPPTSPPTTVPSPGSAALLALKRDLAAGVQSGAVSSGTAATVASAADQAVADQSAGRGPQAQAELQQALAAVRAGAGSAPGGQAAATTLQNDLTSLAHALGVQLPAPAPPPPPGHHHKGGGGGDGGGGGGGKGN